MNEPGRRTQELARALWYVGRGRAELRSAPLAPRRRPMRSSAPPGARSAAAPSASSSRAGVAAVESERMRAPMQEGDFPFPVKYGYCAVGTVEEGPRDLVGRTVFALHPHQDRFAAPAGSLALVPPAVPARRAALAANMETALNARLGFGRRAGRSDPRRRCRRGRAPRRRSRGPAAGGGGHDGRRRSVARRRSPAVSAAPSRSRSTRQATRTSSSTPARPRPDLPAPWPAPASRRRSSS